MICTNCRHRTWICSPSIATAIVAAIITAAGAAIARDGLFVIITVVVAAVSLLFNFCLHVYLVLTLTIRKDTDSNIEFLIWIPKLKFSTLFIYDTLTIRADLIEMIQIQTKTHKHQISEMLAIAAMTLLLIHIADGSMERIIKHGFLPVSIDKKPLGISNFGISSIILFFLAFGIDIREKNRSSVTTTLLIFGGALIGTTALGVSMMDSGKGITTILTVCAMGYVIMGSGILLRAIQRRRVIGLYPKLSKLCK